MAALPRVSIDGNTVGEAPLLDVLATSSAARTGDGLHEQLMPAANSSSRGIIRNAARENGGLAVQVCMYV